MAILYSLSTILLTSGCRKFSSFFDNWSDKLKLGVHNEFRNYFFNADHNIQALNDFGNDFKHLESQTLQSSKIQIDPRSITDATIVKTPDGVKLVKLQTRYES